MKGCGVWNHHRSSSHRSLLFLLFCHASFKQIKLVNINPSDIIEGKPSVVLGLIWTIILYFQVSFSLSLSLLITVIMGTNPPNLKFHSHNDAYTYNIMFFTSFTLDAAGIIRSLALFTWHFTSWIIYDFPGFPWFLHFRSVCVCVYVFYIWPFYHRL